MASMPETRQDSQEGIVLVEARPLLRHEPEMVLREAQLAAQALSDVIAKKPRPVMMNGEQYLEFEDWQTVGRFYGITAKEDGDPEFVEFPDGTRGFKASAVALRDGETISRASAYCLNDEPKWRSKAVYEWLYVTQDGEMTAEDPGPNRIVWEPNPNKAGKSRPKKVRQKVGDEPVPLFQLASMAQTRSNAKVLRNVLAWVVVLAGYRPTPAEEIDGMIPASAVVDAEIIETSRGPVVVGSGQHAAEAGAQPNPTFVGERPPAQAQRPAAKGAKPACPKCQTAKEVISSKHPESGAYYCFACKKGFDV